MLFYFLHYNRQQTIVVLIVVPPNSMEALRCDFLSHDIHTQRTFIHSQDNNEGAPRDMNTLIAGVRTYQIAMPSEQQNVLRNYWERLFRAIESQWELLCSGNCPI